MQMRRFLLALPLLATCIGAAHAGLYSDDMAKCLVASTSQEDKVALVRWVFATAALHPKVASFVNVSAAQREKLNRDMGALVEKLLTETCRKQTQDAVKYEGALAVQQSFNVLGQVAMMELMSDKAVSEGVDAFAQYIDKKKLEAIGLPGK